MIDEKYMRRAIQLAKKGCGFVNPNPMVGAVIVKGGKIIGEGYHHSYGNLHAERDALSNLTESAEDATIYVTLEPCCHTGCQPPCTEAIIENRIKRVVIGSRDPNPMVHGKGCKQLQEHGIEVVEDFLRAECDEINPIFFHYIQTNKPYVVMKYAMTLDGKIATRTGASRWITGEEARAHVHSIRARYSTIMVGIGTVLADDPLLNVRTEGVSVHQPVRVIIDSNLQIPLDSKIVKTADTYKTVVAYASTDQLILGNKRSMLEESKVTLIHCPDESGRVNLVKVMEWLAEQKLDSVLIEGGGQIHEASLKAGIVNHIMAYIAPKMFGGSTAKTPIEGRGVELPSESPELAFTKLTHLGNDLLLEYDVKEGMNHVYWNC